MTFWRNIFIPPRLHNKAQTGMCAVISLFCKMESLSLPEDIDYDDGEVKNKQPDPSMSL